MRDWAAVLAMTLCLATGPAQAETRHYEGALTFRGDTLSVRLALDGDQARLDLPELWYAGEPAALTHGPDGELRLALPFGIGEIPLAPLPDNGGYAGERDGFRLELLPGTPPPFVTHEVTFGAYHPELNGTLYLPEGEGTATGVVLVGGSSTADRGKWGYRSKADWYARRGVAALVYDRRPWDQEVAPGRKADFWSHAEDLRAARALLAAHPRIAADAIGAQAGSQGVWITLVAQDAMAGEGDDHGGGGFDWLVFTGAPAVTPAEQQMQSLERGMRDDGLPAEAIDNATAYQRLYFAVAHRGQGWAELERAIGQAQGTDWGSYVDQPRSLDDLDWWRRHMNHDPGPALSRLQTPLLVMNGSRDWVAPAERNLPLFAHYAERAGNARVRTLTLAGADHRLETQPEEDADGQWRFFRIHPEARAAIEGFIAVEGVYGSGSGSDD